MNRHGAGHLRSGSLPTPSGASYAAVAPHAGRRSPLSSLLDRLSQPLPIDAYRTLVNPLWARDRRGVIEAVTPITPDACAITIRTNRAWPRHDAGQFVTIGVEIDGVRHHRCYSLTSVGDRSGSQLIEIAVQRVPGGLVSTHLTSAARIGDLVHLSGPDGDFTLPSFVPDRLLLISGGSGVTPLVGIVRTLASRPPHSDVVVVHHAPTAERTMFSAELTRLAARHDWLTVHLVHTRDGGARLDPARLDDLCPDWADRETFVCGPTPLIEFVTDHWDAAGALERVHLERFTLDLPAPADPATGDTVTATFATTGSIATAPVGATLLATAEAAGIDAPYGCRTGVCHTCSTRLVSGCTTDVRDGRISEAGTHVQLCVSTPLTDVALDL